VIRVVFGRRMLLTLLLFGWLAGFSICPRGPGRAVRAVSARQQVTVRLLMAACRSAW
jgi:hypothetical protein